MSGKAITVVFWVLLIYILSSLIWWYIALEKQSTLIYKYELQNLEVAQKTNPSYDIVQEKINIDRKRKTRTFQYLGEGTLFFVFIILGSILLYRLLIKKVKLSEMQSNFSMAISHEILTPISTMQLNLESIAKYKEKLSKSEFEELLKDSLLETERLKNMCNNVLTTSFFKTNNKLTLEKLDLKSYLQELLNYYKKFYPNFEFKFIKDKESFILADKNLLELAFRNILNNSIKFSNKEKVIIVELKKEDQKIQAFFKDFGQGIEKSELKKVFQKFYKGTNTIQNTKGSGIGLFVTKIILDKHHAKISVQRNMPQGVTFLLEFNPYR